MHMFAIDGLRIALLSGMIVDTAPRAARVARVVRRDCRPAIWFYTAATGWEPSAVRASVMMTIVLGGWALKRPSDLLNSLAAAAFVILLWNPLQLFEASFQLSFFVMLVIALMLPPLNEFFDRLLKPDPNCCRTNSSPAGKNPAVARAPIRALLRPVLRRMDRRAAARGQIFSPVQPRLDARQHLRRAAGHLRAHGQPRRAHVRLSGCRGRPNSSTTPRGFSWSR
jgi:ComEC/Rec2-related protein